MFWILIEYAVAVSILYGLWSQVFLPLLEDRPMFPALARRESRLREELRDAHQGLYEVDVAAQVKELKEELARREKKVSGSAVDANEGDK